MIFLLILHKNICCVPSLEPSHQDGSNDGENICFKGRSLMFRRYHNSADLFSKLSESSFYKEISKFQ